jgi:hypothetical protein
MFFMHIRHKCEVGVSPNVQLGFSPPKFQLPLFFHVSLLPILALNRNSPRARLLAPFVQLFRQKLISQHSASQSTMTIDHAGVYVASAQHEECVKFYLEALKPLGYEKIMTVGPNGEWVGIGAEKKPDWWICAAKETPNVNNHVAFAAASTSYPGYIPLVAEPSE